MRRRIWIGIACVAAILAIVALTLMLRKHAPPEAARLLPEADAVAYVDLRPLRVVAHFGRSPVIRAPEYQKFIDATGFVFERDLDQAAFALMRMPDPNGPNGAFAFSEIFVGHMDAGRLRGYLHAQARTEAQYAGHTIYELPSQGRNVRVAMLGHDMVAVSNTPTAEQIHSMIDRYRTRWLPFSGSSLLKNYYSKVPLLSPVWAIAKVSWPPQDGGIGMSGIRVPVAEGSAFIGSLRWMGAIHLKIEEIAPNEEAAAASASSVRALLAIARALEKGQPAHADPGFDNLLDSARVRQSGNQAELTATAPEALIKTLLNPPGSKPSPSGKE